MKMDAKNAIENGISAIPWLNFQRNSVGDYNVLRKELKQCVQKNNNLFCSTYATAKTKAKSRFFQIVCGLSKDFKGFH